MKIAILANRLDATDGWSRYAFDLANNLKIAGHQVLCLVNKKSAVDLEQLVVFDNPLAYLVNLWRIFSTGRKVNSLLTKFQPDIIHVVTEPYANCLLGAPFSRAKIVITVHGTYAYSPALLKSFWKHSLASFMAKLVYKKVDLVIAVSSFTKNYLLSKIHSSKLESKIRVVNNGVDLSSFPLGDLIPKENKIKKIIFVGGLKSGKGILEALAGLSYYKNDFSDQFQFNIIGQAEPGTPYYNILEKFIAEHDLARQVVFHGRVSHEALLAAYQEADLFLMSSLNIDNKWLEGFGLVYLEANSQGVPCIGSRESGAVDAILDGETGYLVEARNPIDIAEKINLVLNKRTIKAEDCIAWAKKNSIKHKIAEIIVLYEQNNK
ncbi:glycosyltransferase family 4 protein [Candidatus Kuenenbacteria bacterium]|nr:glycosyltransferase family 4 protein [Candidatus Kuenenbacteria bacterium]